MSAPSPAAPVRDAREAQAGSGPEIPGVAGRPWLSVLIPVFNVAPYLQECVESVLSQADGTVEVLLYDDASTDESPAVMRQLAERHPGRLRLLSAPRNGGLSAARNALLEASRGEWIWFLDSDDYLYGGAIDALRRATALSGADLVLCDFRDVFEKRSFKHRMRERRHRATHRMPAWQVRSDLSELISGSLLMGHLHSWSKIARRELWGDDLRFPVGRYFEDIATSPSLLLRSHGAVYVPEMWVAYRKRAGSILATGNVRKTDDMHAGLDGLPALLDGAHQPITRQARLDCAYFVAKMFISAMRHVNDLRDTPRLAAYFEQYCRNTPCPPEEVLEDWRRRGWRWRRLRLMHWLRVGRRAQALLLSARHDTDTSRTTQP